MFYILAWTWYVWLSFALMSSAVLPLDVGHADPGLYAPVVAVFTAAFAISRSLGIPWVAVPRRGINIIVGFGTLWAAYLWLLHASGSDSLVPVLPIELQAVLILSGSYAAIFFFMLLIWHAAHSDR